MHTGIKMSRDVNLGFLTSSLTFTQDTTTQGVTNTHNASKIQSPRSTLWEAKGPHSHKIRLELTRDVVVFRNVKWDRGRYLYPTTYAGSQFNHFKEKHRFGKIGVNFIEKKMVTQVTLHCPWHRGHSSISTKMRWIEGQIRRRRHSISQLVYVQGHHNEVS